MLIARLENVTTEQVAREEKQNTCEAENAEQMAEKDRIIAEGAVALIKAQEDRVLFLTALEAAKAAELAAKTKERIAENNSKELLKSQEMLRFSLDANEELRKELDTLRKEYATLNKKHDELIIAQKELSTHRNMEEEFEENADENAANELVMMTVQGKLELEVGNLS